MRSRFPAFIAFALLAAPPVALQAQVLITTGEYIDKYKAFAIEDMAKYGIPASITMAQALLESDNGNSALAREGNNHFGIKCKSDWQGETIAHDDDQKGECFRKYASAEQSYRDHSEFLDKSPRYQPLFQLDTRDYAGWARGLKAAGYATNPLYADMLIKIIEANQLYLLDEGKPLPASVFAVGGPAGGKGLGTSVWDEAVADRSADGTGGGVDLGVVAHSEGGYSVYSNNGIYFVVAGDGDTYEDIAGRLGVSASRLRRYNDQSSKEQPAAQSVVYIGEKAKRNLDSRVLHIAAEGESLHSISQLYGIRLKNLARLNHMKATAALYTGQQVRLM